MTDRPPEAVSRQRAWEDHRREQLVLGLAVTPAERLAWLEEMIDFAYRAGALPRREANR
jgi:hypothetical protein